MQSSIRTISMFCSHKFNLQPHDALHADAINVNVVSEERIRRLLDTFNYCAVLKTYVNVCKGLYNSPFKLCDYSKWHIKHFNWCRSHVSPINYGAHYNYLIFCCLFFSFIVFTKFLFKCYLFLCTSYHIGHNIS